MKNPVYGWNSPFGERPYWTCSAKGMTNRMGTIEENLIASGKSDIVTALKKIR